MRRALFDAVLPVADIHAVFKKPAACNGGKVDIILSQHGTAGQNFPGHIPGKAGIELGPKPGHVGVAKIPQRKGNIQYIAAGKVSVPRKVNAMGRKFPKRIKSLRQDLDIRQNEMADILGVPSTTYANWEQGRAFPSVDRLPRIAAFFDVTVDYLIGANRSTVNRRIVEQLAVLSPEQRQAVELVLSSMNSSNKSSKS